MKFVWSTSGGSDEAFLETIPTATTATDLETLHVVYDAFQPSLLAEGGLKDAAAPWLERVADLVEANKKTLETVHLDIPFVPQITSQAVAFTFFASKASAAHLTRLLNTLLFNMNAYGGHDRKAFVCGIPLNHFQITSVMTV